MHDDNQKMTLTYQVSDAVLQQISTQKRSFKDWLLDSSIYFSFDVSGYHRHQRLAPTFPKLSGSEHIIVTGANSGVGYALTDLLMARGIEVTMICRSAQRGKVAQQRLRSLHNREPHLYLADLTDLDQVDEVCSQIQQSIQKKDLNPISCLVHNAGLLPSKLILTSTGHEVTVGAHLIGPTRMTARLLDSFAEHSRIIFMSSGGMYFAPLDTAKMLDYPKLAKDKYDGVFAYALSKRAQVELAHYLHKQFQLNQRHIDVQSIHPGWADTPGVEAGINRFYQKMQYKLRNPKQGAYPTEWLCCLTPLRDSHFWFDWAPRSPYLLGKRPTQSKIEALWTMVCEGAALEPDWVS